MASDTKFLSIKSLIIWVVMAITSLSLIFSSGVNLYSQISTYRQSLEDNVVIYSEMIGRDSMDSLIKDEGLLEEENLKILSASELIENVHIYRIMDDQTIKFFASYNKEGIAPVKAKFDQVDQLYQPKMAAGVMEIIRPIRNEKQVVGYLYLRASADGLQKLTSNSIILTVSVLLACLLVCFLFTIKLQRAITAPINVLVKLVQRISRQKDYSSRAELNGIKELDILGEAFNNMLQRTQEHMQRQTIAEAEQAKLNTSLEGKVKQRTNALKEANSELIQTLEKLHQFQRQMVQNEKMASLGDMVAGVAHEVNTPIGLGVTASTMMLDRLSDMRKAFEDKTLKASSLSKFIAEGEENLNIIYRNLNRAAELISSFKQVAVDQSSENNRVFSFAKLMEEILMSMRPKLKKVKHQINVNCADNLVVESKAGPINQIIINLIMNSIIHGFEDMDKGQIDINIQAIGDTKVSIEFKDNGKGIPEHLRKRIFDPFVTTKRGQGGSGLGMHLVYNLVTQALNGSISIVSEEGEGVQFKILFPVKKVTHDKVHVGSFL
ncbi:HAMP domain-containing sensor histidine kinase [uncultured Paraglaciecola sp.]|uniref:sensor histidine kinase n=1 Tax=uncultured Paraglaciecola sp. TaxID=1765024 RepID=UPI0030D73F41|tara:strand:+ start:58895 stop:60544 length:1650 start_codon:yes stop_codon:yes gene_type:complete